VDVREVPAHRLERAHPAVLQEAEARDFREHGEALARPHARVLEQAFEPLEDRLEGELLRAEAQDFLDPDAVQGFVLVLEVLAHELEQAFGAGVLDRDAHVSQLDKRTGLGVGLCDKVVPYRGVVDVVALNGEHPRLREEGDGVVADDRAENLRHVPVSLDCVKILDGFDGQDSPDRVVVASAWGTQVLVLPRTFHCLDVDRGQRTFLHEVREEFGFVVLGVDD
jgi:hypothetical protein